MPIRTEAVPATAAIPGGLLRLGRELGELKRVRSAGRPGSIAERLFVSAWSELVAGEEPGAVMRGHVGRALLATRLGDLDRTCLEGLGLSPGEIGDIFGRTFAEVLAPVEARLGATLAAQVRLDEKDRAVPAFVAALAEQPRAGSTCPGRPRLVLEPAENHAEHCASVACMGVLFAPVYGADPVRVWLGGMVHHLHNAAMPDAGFVGEVLLGPLLERTMRVATERAMAELPADLAGLVTEAMRILPDARTAEGRAFHAADTLDRVWQIEQHLRPGQIGLDLILGDMALVHEGPAKGFQDQVLRDAGLIA